MIKFKKIRFKNFLSFGNNFTEIFFDKSPTTLITGDNGSGKSTFLDALTFSLYGKPFRKINKPQIVNSINSNKCLVEIEFSSGDKHYLVRRGIKPSVFEIFESTSPNEIDAISNLIKQDSSERDYQEKLEKNILKMNYEAFTQVVILGKATYVPFMRLEAAKRRSVVEDLLGLKIFGVMNTLLKDKLKTLKGDLSDVEKYVDVLVDKIDSKQRYVDDLKKNQQDRVDEIKNLINQLIEDISSIEDDIINLNNKREEHVSELNDDVELLKKRRSLDSYISKFQNKIETLEKMVEFLSENDTCPTCTQSIDKKFKYEKIEEDNGKISKLNEGLSKVEEDLVKVEQDIDSIKEINEIIRLLDKDISNKVTLKKEKTNSIKKLDKTLSDMDALDLEKDENDIIDMENELEVVREKRIEYQELNLYYTNILSMLKDDGIKSLIIKKYLPIFNELINRFLTKMGFLVQFTLDEEFNEEILSRYRDNFSYNNFSEGQKLRIDLSILLTWREIAKLKNSLNTNLLIMDEVFDSSLDQDGVDAFIDILPSLGDTNVFVVSHTQEKLHDKFRSHIGFKLNNNFSEITKES